MIRLAETSDLARILEIYQIAREFMRQQGNGGQWAGGYPSQDLLEEDIRKKHLYVYREDDIIHGLFAFILGEDPAYQQIEDGAWLNDAPYGTIHRIAADGETKGVFDKCLAYCRGQINNIRIDTHEKNTVMQHLIAKNGFTRCGIVYMPDGSPRIAYQQTWPAANRE